MSDLNIQRPTLKPQSDILAAFSAYPLIGLLCESKERESHGYRSEVCVRRRNINK